jgi:hypothetical protein
LQHFATEGQWEYREASKLLNRVFDMSQAVLNRNQGKFLTARGLAMEQHRVIAEGKRGTRMAMGATPGRERLTGYKVLGDPSLAPNEVYVPGMEEGIVGNVFRFPTAGEESFDPSMQAVNIGAVAAKERGLQLGRMYVSEHMQQAIGGDFDADIDYFLASGEATIKEGRLYDQEGNLLDPEAIIRMGATRRAEGAGDMMEERPPMWDKNSRTARELAVQSLRDTEVHTMGLSKIEEQSAAQNALQGMIGPFYQSMRRWISRAPEGTARQGVQKLWNMIHGRAQRPAALPEDLQQLMDMTKVSGRRGFFSTRKGRTDHFGEESVLRGLQSRTGSVMHELVSRGVYSARFAGELMGVDPQSRSAIRAAYQRYSTDPDAKAITRNWEHIRGEVMSIDPEEWATRASSGQFYGGAWALRQWKKHGTMGYFRGQGISEPTARELIRHGEEMQDATDLVRKGKRQGEEGYIEQWADVAEREGESWVASRKIPYEAPMAVSDPRGAAGAIKRATGTTATQAKQAAAVAPVVAPSQAAAPRATRAVPWAKDPADASASLIAAPTTVAPTSAPSGPRSLAQQAYDRFFGGRLGNLQDEISRIREGGGANRVDARLTRQAVNWMSTQGASANEVRAAMGEWQGIVRGAGGEFVESDQGVWFHRYGGGGRGQPPIGGANQSLTSPSRRSGGQRQGTAAQIINMTGAAEPWGKGAWFSGGKIDELEKAKEDIQLWGKAVASNIATIEETNKEQKAFLKTYEKYHTSVKRGLEIRDKMEQYMESSEFQAQPQKWQKNFIRRMNEGGAAVHALAQSPGYQAMQGAAQIDADRTFMQQYLAATGRGGGGGDGGGTILNRALAGGQFRDLGMMGRVAGGLHSMLSGWELMRMQRMWSLTGAPAFDQFMPAAAEAEMAGWQVSQGIGGYEAGLPGGAGGGLMAFEAAKRQSDIDAGRTAYNAWGWTRQASGAWNQARAFGGPAVGAGLIAGGLASTLGSMAIPGLSAAGAATVIGLPVTGAVGAMGLATAGNQYLANIAQPTATNQLALADAQAASRQGVLQGGGLDSFMGTARLLGVTMGRQINQNWAALREGRFGDMLTSMGNLPASWQYSKEQAAQGAQLQDMQLGQMDARQRNAALNYVAGQLANQPGGAFEGMDATQVLQAYGAAVPYLRMSAMGSEELMSGDVTGTVRRWATTGGPGQYEQLASGIGGGRQLAIQMEADFAQLGQYAAHPFQSALGKYSGMAQMGYAPGDIYSGVMSGALGNVSGRDALSLSGAYGMRSQFGQAFGAGLASQRSAFHMFRHMSPEQQTFTQMAMPYAGAVSQATGTGAWNELDRFRTWAEAGVSPQAMSIMAQQLQGQGAVGQAMGLPGGFSEELPLMGRLAAQMMQPADYARLQSMGGLGASKMGYSMMAGGWGVGGLLNRQWGMMGMEAPSGPALMDEQGWSIGQREQRALRWQGFAENVQHQQFGFDMRAQQLQMQESQMYASQAFTMQGLDSRIDMAQALIEVTKELRGLNNELRALRRSQARRGLEFAEEGLEMQTRQGLERLAMSRQMQQEQVRYQRESMGLTRGIMETQFEWQQQDFAFGRQMAGFQQEFQMGELERSIRFATGRQKQGLIRRREYQEEMYAMQEQQRGTQEGRAQQQQEWEVARFEMQKRHFENVTALQEKQFNMQERHILERYALEKEKLDEQRKNMEEIWAMEDKIRAVQEAWQDKQQQHSLDQLKRQKEYYEFVHQQERDKMEMAKKSYQEDLRHWRETVKFQREEMALRDKIESAHAKYLEWQMKMYRPGGDIYNAFKELLDMIGAKAAEASAAASATEQYYGDTDPKPDSVQGYSQSSTLAEDLFKGASLKLKVGDQEFDAYLEGTNDDTSFRRDNAGSWGGAWQ